MEQRNTGRQYKVRDPLFEQFKRELTALSNDPQPVILQISKLEAWALLAQLQLALRHTMNHGKPAQQAFEIAIALQKVIATTPTLREIARRGWHKEYDR